jgi:hypothetical protein
MRSPSPTRASAPAEIVAAADVMLADPAEAAVLLAKLADRVS